MLGKVGEYLAVEQDVFLVEGADELRVRVRRRLS